MGRNKMRRGVAMIAALVMLPIAIVGVTSQTASAASEAQFVSSWTGSGGGQWVPSAGSTNAHGASDGLCIAASSQPGGAEAFFSFPVFSIPGGNVIDGVEVTVDYETDGEQIIQLSDGGAVTGSSRPLPANAAASTCDGTSDEILGGPNDLWGGTFTPADFNAGNIGVYLQQKIVTLSSGDPGSLPIDIDSVKLTVHHSDGANQAPTAEANGPYNVAEGGSVELSSLGSVDPDGNPLTITWDLDNDGTFETTSASPTFSAAGRDGPDAQTVAIKVFDGSLDDIDTATVNITNVAPTIGSIGVSAASSDEGDSVTVSGTFSDPGSGETYTGTALWSDGASTSVSVVGTSFSTSRTFPDDHPATGTASDPFTVDITIDDGDLGVDTATSPVITVSNVDPSIDSIGLDAASIDEGGSVTVAGTFSDPALGEPTETFSGSATWSDGPGSVVTVGDGTYSTTRTFLDDDPSTGTASDNFTVDVTIDDDDLGSDSATSPTVTVNNVAPVLGPLSLSEAVIDENGSVTLTGSFTDVGVLDTHTVTVDWGEGPVQAATVVQGSGAGTFTASHQYLDDDPTGTPSDGYTITVTVTDDDTGSDSDTTSVTVDNVDPAITSIVSSATFEDKADEGETVTVSGAFTDIGTLDTHTATFDWDDGNIEPATITQGVGGGTFTADHAYAAGGVYTVVVTITDDDTGTASDSVLAVVTGVGINGGVLQVVGTADDDMTHVKRIRDEIDVFADFIGHDHRRYDLSDVSAIEIWLCEGDDRGNVHRSIDLPATIHGGAGDDMLWGGSGPDVIHGEDGDDKLWGRRGDDELYGGADEDRLWGGKGTNLVVP